MTDRPFNTAVYLLRCIELGLSVEELNMLDYGMVTDILTERGNDGCEYKYVATQEDFDRF